jgi:hypothetical protein
MFQRLLSLALILALTQALAAVPAVAAKSKAEKEAERAGKVKAGILQLGAGRESQVTVKLRDKTRLAGYISEVGEESFVLTDSKTGASTTIAYPTVTQVTGHNLSKGAKIAIGVGIAVAVVVVLIIVRGAFCDGC